MTKEDEIIKMLQEIQADMGGIAAGRLKKPEISGMKIEATPLNADEAKAELKSAMEADEAKEGPEGDKAEDPQYQELEEALGVEKHPSEEAPEETEEEVLPRWKQRLKNKGK